MSTRYVNILSKRHPSDDDDDDDVGGDQFGGWFYSEVRHSPLLDKRRSDDFVLYRKAGRFDMEFSWESSFSLLRSSCSPTSTRK